MYSVYQIMQGDTLESIASKSGVDVSELRRINGIFNNSLVPGGYLIVPNMSNSEYETYIVKTGDNLYAIARNKGVDYKTLLSINGLKEDEYIYPNQEILIPKGRIYVTTKEDTIEDVLNILNMTYDDLKNNNKSIYLLEDQIIKY